MKKKTLFEKIQDDQTAQGVNHWAPFNNQDEWDLARWLNQNVGQKATDEYLKLAIVSGYHTW